MLDCLPLFLYWSLIFALPISVLAADSTVNNSQGGKGSAAAKYLALLDFGAFGGKSAGVGGVSADGSVVVGTLQFADGPSRPFVVPIGKDGQVVIKAAAGS